MEMLKYSPTGIQENPELEDEDGSVRFSYNVLFYTKGDDPRLVACARIWTNFSHQPTYTFRKDFVRMMPDTKLSDLDHTTVLLKNRLTDKVSYRIEIGYFADLLVNGITFLGKSENNKRG